MLAHHILGDLLVGDGAAALPGLGLAPLPHVHAAEGLVLEEGQESDDDDDQNDEVEEDFEQDEEEQHQEGDEDEDDEEQGEVEGALERRRRGRLHEVLGRYLLAFFSLGFDFSPRCLPLPLPCLGLYVRRLSWFFIMVVVW